jgi:hypothetical protein
MDRIDRQTPSLLFTGLVRSVEEARRAVARGTGTVLALLARTASINPQTVCVPPDTWHGIRWQGRPELRGALPTLDDLATSPHFFVGVWGLGEHAREYWLCAEPSDSKHIEFETCEESADFSEFYGQPMFICTTASPR